MKEEIYNNLPSAVKKILVISGGWLVGSAVENILEGTLPEDFDILVTDSDKFHKTLLGFSGIKLNTFGGIKIKGYGFDIDIWSDSLENFLSKASKVKYIYKIEGNKLIQIL